MQGRDENSAREALPSPPPPATAGTGGSKGLAELFTEPLHSRFRRPMTAWYDYLSLAGLVVFAISLFATYWINVTISVPNLLTDKQVTASQGYGLFESGWGWVALAVFIAVVAGLWFVQFRGLLSLGAGIYCLSFTVLFSIGVWWRINAIIGDYESFARTIPLVGNLIADLLVFLAKEYLDVSVSTGFWLFIPAGVLLVAGGLFRYLDSRRLQLRSSETDG